MVTAYREGFDAIQPHHIIPQPRGIAEAILRGNPTKAYPYIRHIVHDSNGDFESVTDAEIRASRKLVEELEGLSPCFTASAAVAGLIKQVKTGKVPKEDTVVVNLTGGDRTRSRPEQLAGIHWLVRDAHGGWHDE